MAKKIKTSKILGFVQFGVLLFGLAACAMLFVNTLTTGEDAFYKGTDVVFGVSSSFLGQSASLKFSFLGFLAFILPVVAGILAIFPVNKKYSNYRFLGCTVLLLVSALLFFIMPSYINKVYLETILGNGTLDVEFKLAIGAILGGVFSAIAAVISAAKVVLK